MSNRAINIPSSFINLNPELYLTDRDCAIVKPFCLPIYEAADLKFQLRVNILGLVGSINFDNTRISLLDSDGSVWATVLDATITNYLEGEGIYYLHFDFTDSDILLDWAIGACHAIKVELELTPESGPIEYIDLGTSFQCLQRIPDNCYSSKITYYNNESAFGLYYPNSNWACSIRLPIYFRNAQVKNDQDVYVRSNGTRTKLYARLSKQYQGLVDNVTEEVHQKLVIALSHDNVTFVTDNGYELECTFENEYNNNFPEILMGVNVWTSDFLVMETPFDEQNNNCV